MSEIPQDGPPAWQPGGPPVSWQPSPGWVNTPGASLEPHVPDEPVLVTIGDISVTATRVFTPSGSVPVSEVSWNLTDMSQTTEAIPTWAIVCAIVFFVFCLLGLLFLLVKETRTQGSVQVTVTGKGFVHTTQIPVVSPAQIADLGARVNHARGLSASAQAAVQAGPQGQDQGHAPDQAQGQTQVRARAQDIWNQPPQPTQRPE